MQGRYVRTRANGAAQIDNSEEADFGSATDFDKRAQVKINCREEAVSVYTDVLIIPYLKHVITCSCC